MDDTDFDRALIGAAFELAAERGWDRVTVVAAALRAGLKLDRARARFPSRGMILLRFGRLADMAALGEASGSSETGTGESTRDQLFAMVMRRIDVLQAHRAGVLALLRWLHRNPMTALMLAAATRRSMAWLLEAAGLSSTGLRGGLRTKGLLAVWFYTVRAWERDESADLSATMAALDQALRRAGRAEEMMPCRGRRRADAEPTAPPSAPEAPPEPPAAAPDLPIATPPPPDEPPPSPA